jgi:hypothetical protein
MFDWILKKGNKGIDPCQIPILNRETDIENLPYKFIVYYYSIIYNKLREILGAVFDGYDINKHLFLPPRA